MGKPRWYTNSSLAEAQVKQFFSWGAPGKAVLLVERFPEPSQPASQGSSMFLFLTSVDSLIWFLRIYQNNQKSKTLSLRSFVIEILQKPNQKNQTTPSQILVPGEAQVKQFFSSGGPGKTILFVGRPW